MAITLSLFTWILALSASLVKYEGLIGLVEADKLWLHLTIVLPPVAVFLVVYVAGQSLTGTTLWMDHVCVGQANPLTKLATLQSIPTYVARSRNLLVLWDSTFFQRLWCNYEVAIFAKTTGSHAMHFVPTWVPIWTLMLFGLACLQVVLTSLSSLPLVFNTNSRMELFLSGVAHNAPGAYAFLAATVPLLWFCLQKLHHHRTMLEQMSHFDIRDAKCTLESDRVVIMQLVTSIFDEALEAPVRVAFGVDEMDELDDCEEGLIFQDTLEAIRHVTSYPTKDEILEEFNEFVRGSLQDKVLHHLGCDTDIPLKLCVVGILPLLFCLPLYSCEAQACSDYASHLGLHSSGYLVFMNTCLNVILVPGAQVVSFPLQMRGSAFLVSKVAHSGLQVFLVFCLAVGVETTVCTYVCVVNSMGLVVAAKYSPWWLAGLLACLDLWCWSFWFLFVKARVMQERHVAHAPVRNGMKGPRG